MGELKQKLEKIIEGLRQSTASIRTGRATPALVEDVAVDYYGVKTPLKALASISVPGPREIVIQPWDRAALQPIESAIQASSLGLAPIADRDVIRLSIPALTEERRREFVKNLHRHAEDARIAVRAGRDDAMKEIDRREKAKDISEDERFRLRADAQKTVDECNKKIEELVGKKEQEIMAV